MSSYPFVPALPDAYRGRDMPPVLDLSARPGGAPSALLDQVDAVAADAMPDVAGAVALWRAWRLDGPGSRRRVFVLQTDSSVADPRGVAGLLTSLLDPDGAAGTDVAVYRAGEHPDPAALAARNASALLWAAEPGGDLAVARVFDAVDPVTGPRFDDDHEWLGHPGEGSVRDTVQRYLDDGVLLLGSTDLMGDVIAPQLGPVVPMSFRTDGRWIWTDTVAYYVREYGLAPDARLLDHIQERQVMVPALVSDVARHRALATLFRPAGAEPVWRA
ncbi:hypothetical protein [Spirilliplanes yamanashiensis]|uniref:hypothetical protein n=1 Tax=Spirilliplanes yamanashiensis TaxID=42233 RepID=UPI00194E0BF9|nr:hypothetical protein [Spirilliplanes yamanashiensis]MDP9817278.1 hypothetical protein [Spirilliplanes yamanashiensis]